MDFRAGLDSGNGNGSPHLNVKFCCIETLQNMELTNYCIVGACYNVSEKFNSLISKTSGRTSHVVDWNYFVHKIKLNIKMDSMAKVKWSSDK